MEWYYAEDKNPIGPLSKQEFTSLVNTGKITSATLVWRRGMRTWGRYGRVGAPRSDFSMEVPSAEGIETSVCSRCGVEHPVETMVGHRDAQVCMECKPLSVEELEEAGIKPEALNYAGFWVRFAAKVVDILILIVIGFVFGFGASIVGAPHGADYDSTTMKIFLFLVELLLAALYTTWFLGTYGATPGKMAFNLLVVTPGGGKIGYLRALGRHLAELLLSRIISLLLGYLMAAFDTEKRTLHDRLCKTRVIRSK